MSTLAQRVTLAFIEDACAWAVSTLAVDPRAPAAASTAAGGLFDDGRDVHPVVGLEFHHDGTRRTDVILFTREDGLRRMAMGGFTFAAVAQDAFEFDTVDVGTVHAGTFHRVADARVPPALEGFGSPLLLAEMPARDGNVRAVYSLRDADDLFSWTALFERDGIPAEAICAMPSVATLIGDGRRLRLAIELDRATGLLGSRVGIEAVLNPTDPAVCDVLVASGVATSDLERLRDLAALLPQSGRYRPRVPDLPAMQMDERTIVAEPVHFSLSWRHGAALVKTYVAVRSAV